MTQIVTPSKGAYSPKKDPNFSAYHDAMQLCVDYTNPYWELAIRLYSLWRGKVPWQLDGTFSKIMLQIGHALIEDRKPKLFDNLLGADHPFTLEANDPVFEGYVDQAFAWANYLMFDEDKVNFRYSANPTLTSALVMGTGYRMPCVRYVQGEPVITDKDIDFFQILPCPNGGLVNPMDGWEYEACDFFFYIDWLTDEQLEKFSRYPGFNKEAFAELKKTARDTSGGIIEHTYREKYNIIGGILYNDEHNWRTRLGDIVALSETSGRRRVVHWFRRDKWFIVVQDNFIIYEGNPPFGPGILPLVKYATVPDFKNWFGIGTLEMTEDMILAMLMNFNYRFDHMAKVLFPAKFIRDDVMGNKTEADFYDRPYQVHSFPMSVQRISDAVWYDRAPEVDSQQFIEEDRLRMFMQEISGMPNYSKGIGGQGTLSNETATGIVSLIKEAQGRLAMESQNLEREGLAQQIRLLLMLGEKHINSETVVKDKGNRSGFPWTVVDPEAIGDRYTVLTHGASKRAIEEATFQKMLALLPAFLNDPYTDPIEIRRQTHEVSNVWPEPEKLLMQPEPAAAIQQGQGMGGYQEQTPIPRGGAASATDMRQRNRSTSQRNEAAPGGGTRSASPVAVGG